MEDNAIFRTVLFRRTGTMHIKDGKDCEDSVSRSYDVQSGVLVIALSDGAGSCAKADIGSDITARTASEFLAQKFNLLYELDDDTVSSYILREVTAALRTEADRDGTALEEYSATLLLAVMHPDGRYLIFHVGDGAVIGFTDKCESIALSLYDHIGFANETTFVTEPDTEYRILRGSGGFYAFSLMSDGPEEFMVNEVEVSPRVTLMHQLAFALSENNMEQQLNSMVELFNEKGMYDEASFALISDSRASSAVFRTMNSALRETLIGTDAGPKQARRREVIIQILSAGTAGVTVQEMTRRLHTHSPRITKKKMQPFIERGIVELVAGKYHLVR